VLTLIGFLIFIYSIILHEIAHGLAAERLGDPTARVSGRLTLNPFPHIDPLMSIVVPFFLLLSGSPIIFGSAKPVPIDPYNLRNPRKDMGTIGLAGPAANLLLALCFALIARFLVSFFPNPSLLKLLGNVAFVNIVLAVFNLIPIPPLDGGRVMVAILPDKYSEALAGVERFGMFLLLFLLFFPTSFFSLPGVISKITNLLFGLIFPGFPLI